MRVLTLGTFDLFHVGHVRLFGRCRQIAGREGHVTVAVNRDEFVGQYKGRLPVIPLDARMEVIASCRFVDAVVVNAQGVSALPTITDCHPDVIVVGDDWQRRDYLGQLGVTAEELGDVGIVYVPYTRGVSSSLIRERVA